MSYYPTGVIKRENSKPTSLLCLYKATNLLRINVTPNCVSLIIREQVCLDILTKFLPNFPTIGIINFGAEDEI